MKIIILLFALLWMMFCKCQDTICVISPSRHSKALVHYYIDALKSSNDTIYLTKRNRKTLSADESLIRQQWEAIFDQIIEKSTIYKVLHKGELVEICAGNVEYYTGGYTLFDKDNSVLIRGQFDLDGKKVGTWQFFNKKGKLKSSITY